MHSSKVCGCSLPACMFVCLCLAMFCPIYAENASEINSANYLCLVYNITKHSIEANTNTHFTAFPCWGFGRIM